jgi:hypothetical protein
VLHATQESDGGWGFGSASPSSSSEVVQGLVAVGENPFAPSWSKVVSGTVTNAADAILAQQGDSGCWPNLFGPGDDPFSTTDAVLLLVQQPVWGTTQFTALPEPVLIAEPTEPVVEPTEAVADPTELPEPTTAPTQPPPDPTATPAPTEVGAPTEPASEVAQANPTPEPLTTEAADGAAGDSNDLITIVVAVAVLLLVAVAVYWFWMRRSGVATDDHESS